VLPAAAVIAAAAFSNVKALRIHWNAARKVPENGRHDGGIVPDGFHIGDAGCRAIRRAWKRQKRDLEIEDEQQFDGW
jgi:hypothetical protein